MTEKEKQEIESIRVDLIKMFEDDPYVISCILPNITQRLWKLSHKKNNNKVNTIWIDAEETKCL